MLPLLINGSGPPGVPGKPELHKNGVTQVAIWCVHRGLAMRSSRAFRRLQWTPPTDGGEVEKYELDMTNAPWKKTVRCSTNAVEVS